MADEEDGGVYRVTDNIRNLMIRVKLKRIDIVNQEEDENFSGEEVIDIKWQEKYFSQHEEDLYSNEWNCHNSLHKSYHDRILLIRERGGRSNKNLFTYTNQDVVVRRLFIDENDTVLVNAEHVTGRETIPRNRMPSAYRGNDESMYIMLNTTDSIEHVLCHLKLKQDGTVLVISPDLSDSVWHKIDCKQDCAYEYHLENISLCIDRKSKQRQEKLTLKALELMSKTIPKRTLPDKEIKKCPSTIFILGSIVSASGFGTSSSLYVQVNIINKGWDLEGSSMFVTQISESSKDNCAHFSCPLELEFSPPPSSSQGDESVFGSWPSLAVEVCSLDRWDRHCVVGYGNTHIPQYKGYHCLCINTWRPSPVYLKDQLKEYFIGGGLELRDQTNESQTASNTKYGLQTESSGSVEIYLNIAFQYV